MKKQAHKSFPALVMAATVYEFMEWIILVLSAVAFLAFVAFKILAKIYVG
jgi:hypothetical protein